MNYVSLESCELLANIKAMVSLQELCKTYPIKSMECKKKKKKKKSCHKRKFVSIPVAF